MTNRERAEALLHKLEMSNGPYAQRLDAVERAIVEAVAEEREECAKVAEDMLHVWGAPIKADAVYEAIRARGAK